MVSNQHGEKPFLTGSVICVVGDLCSDADEHCIPEQWNYDNVKRWVELRKGQVVQQMDDNVTHLICSRVAFKAKGSQVKYALKRERRKKCKVVTYEWLEDSILYGNRKLSTEVYHPARPRRLEDILANLPKLKKKTSGGIKKGKTEDTKDTEKEKVDTKIIDKEKESTKVVTHGKEKKTHPEKKQHTASSEGLKGEHTVTEDGSKQEMMDFAERYIDPRLYRIAKSSSGVSYEAELTRPDEIGNARGDRWVLELYQSRSDRTRYWFGAKHYSEKRGPVPDYHRQSATDGDPIAELGLFKTFFKDRTGFRWDDRREHAGHRKKGKYLYESVQKPGHPAPPDSAPANPSSSSTPPSTPKFVKDGSKKVDASASQKRKVDDEVGSGRPAKVARTASQEVSGT